MFIPESLYKEIRFSMPIPCIDLIVKNEKGEILLLKRNNEPAKGQWWFPGGRVYFLESRRAAALRKLHEECGLSGNFVKETGTYDLFLETKSEIKTHAITTIYEIHVTDGVVKIDNQTEHFAWLSLKKIFELKPHKFILNALSNLNLH